MKMPASLRIVALELVFGKIFNLNFETDDRDVRASTVPAQMLRKQIV